MSRAEEGFRRRNLACSQTRRRLMRLYRYIAMNPLLKLRDIHPLDPLARPRRFAEEGKAGFDARIVEEAAHRQATSQFSPPMPFD